MRMRRRTKLYMLQETDHLDQQSHHGIHSIGHPEGGAPGADTAGWHGFLPEVDVLTPGKDGVYGPNPAIIGSPDDDGYVRLGPDFSRQYNLLLYTNNYAKALATYTLGEHTFEGGAEYHRIGIDDKFVQGAQSVVRFDSEADFAAGRISQNVNTATNGIASDVRSGFGGFPGLYRQRLQPDNQNVRQRRGGRRFQFRHQLLFPPGHLLSDQGHDGADGRALRSLRHEPLWHHRQSLFRAALRLRQYPDPGWA